MTDTARKLRALYGVSILVMATVVGGIFGGLGGAAAGNNGVSLDCVGNSGGAAYVTDSGLTVYENDPDATHGNFGAAGNSATFDGVTLSAAGNAQVRLDDASPHTCLGNVQGEDNPITVDPDGDGDGATPVVIESDVSEFVYREPVFSSGDDEADLAFDGSGTVSLTIKSTGLGSSTTIVAEDADTGDQLAEAQPSASGSLSLDIPASVHRVDLYTQSDTPTSTANTPTPTPTPTPEPPTLTPTPTPEPPTLTPTPTPEPPTPTPTDVPPDDSTPTDTPSPSSSTPTPTSELPTPTPEPRTPTPAPPTPTPTADSPTPTPEPPTPTPTVDSPTPTPTPDEPTTTPTPTPTSQPPSPTGTSPGGIFDSPDQSPTDDDGSGGGLPLLGIAGGVVVLVVLGTVLVRRNSL